MCHWVYKREKYTFINANIRVIKIILKIIRDNRQTFKCKRYSLTFLWHCLQFNSLCGRRKKGRGRGEGEREKGREPLPPPPNPPPLFPFLPIPYPLPLSTPATQASNSIAFLDSFRMDKTNINALVQSIERSLHSINKNLFSIKQYQFPPKLTWICLKYFRVLRHCVFVDGCGYIHLP